MTSTQWVEYHNGTKRKSYNTLPTSNITAEAVTVDGFTLSQTDNAGVMTTFGRSYTDNGMIHTHTDGRGNTSTTVTDTAGRTLTVTDAAGNVTTTAYDPAHDLPATVTDAQGNTSCYRYDVRGRKVAEWGTGIQPVLFGYDDADRMVTLTTFRCPDEVITTDPSEHTEKDVTTWSYHDASGLETAKTYADNSSVVKTYDDYNRVLTETDARGKVKTHSYEPARGLHLSTTYSDATTPRAYTYNHLGQLTQVTDAAGVCTLSYNAYGEQETDSLLADNVTHLITKTRDDKGRSTGYSYAKNGTVQQTVTTGYGSDGRISSAGFLHSGAEKQFSYEYLSGTHLLEKLTMPNNMTLTQSYEIQRDLLTGMAYHRGTTLVANRQYSYDTLGRPTARNTSRQGTVKNDSFGYNNRSELTTATVNGNNYAYAYDNIGNRNTAQEVTEEITNYTTNNLNQYTAVGDFTPTFDADGNQTLVKTTTGVWSITYDAENRPVNFTNTEANTVIECCYDSMGRRATKKVTVDGEVTLHQRYLYRGYLQIACCDLTRSNHPCLWLITWDLSQPIATRPLAIQKDATWYSAPARLASQDSRSQVCSRLGVWLLKSHPAYGWDLTKNICELYGSNGYIRTAYTYTPYGAVTESGNGVYQPIQWSSEYNDTELGLVYYNYRHYNPLDGRWLGRDMINIYGGYNLYKSYNNNVITTIDFIGLDVYVIIGSPSLSRDKGRHDKNPWNFLNVGLRRAKSDAINCWNPLSKKCCCRVYVLIYKPGYDRRTENDRRNAYPQRSKVEDLAKEWHNKLNDAKKCASVLYFYSAKDIINYLKRIKKKSISKLDYLGHSCSTDLLVEYGSILNANDGSTPESDGEASSSDYITNEDLIESLHDKFSDNGEFNHYGCHGASCAKDMYERNGVNSKGASEKTDYNPAGAGGRRETEPSGNYQTFP